MKVTLALALGVALAAQQGDPVVHVSKEPRHKVVFESGTTRVQDVQIPAGDTSLYHIHDHALLYVPISSSRVRSQVLGQDWNSGGAARDGAASTAARGGGASAAARGGQASAGARRGGASTPPDTVGAAAAPAGPGRVTSTIGYVERPLTHRIGNIGDTLYRLIAVSNLSGGSDSNADDISGLAATPEVLNRYYRAFRVSLAPGAASPAHRHAWPVVLVQQTAGQVAIDGTMTVTLSEPARFAFLDGTRTHAVKNTGTMSVEVIEVELRGGRAK